MYDGDHTAYGMEGTGATGEDAVHKRTENPSRRGRVPPFSGWNNAM